MEVNILFFQDMHDSKYFWETDWIRELFPSTTENTYNLIQYEESKKYINPILVISTQTYNFIDRFIDNNFILLHLSDETLTDTNIYKYYNHPNCKHVFRNYWNENLYNTNITTLPLGYKMGMFKDSTSKETQEYSNRQYKWSFCGHLIKSGRRSIISTIQHILPYYGHEIKTWNASNSLNPIEYKNVLKDTKIVPCLIGNVNIDTFRLYEALECGCVPIVNKINHNMKQTKEYYKQIFGNHPLPVVDNMLNELQTTVTDLLDNNFEEKRRHIFSWYNNYKGELKTKLKSIVKNSFKQNITSTPYSHIFFICDKQNEPERHANLCKQILDTELPKEKYDFFTHIWGNQITNEIRQHYCKSDFSMQLHNRSMQTKPLTNGEISLFLNHIECLRKIRKEYNNGLFFIFESDVIFCKDFENCLNNVCKEVSCIDDWDVINVGEGIRETSYAKSLGYPKSPPITNNIFTFHNEDRHSCTEGILWNYKSICKFLTYFETKEDIDSPFDTKMDVYSYLGEFKIYWAYPTLVKQGSICGLYKSLLR